MVMTIILFKEARADATNEVVTDALGSPRFLLVRAKSVQATMTFLTVRSSMLGSVQ